MLIFDPSTGKNVYVPSQHEAAGLPKLCAYEFCKHPLCGEAYRQGNSFYCSTACREADRRLPHETVVALDPKVHQGQC